MARLQTRSDQRGVVLLLAIIALLLISAVGAAILYMAASESGFVGSQRAAARSFYAGLAAWKRPATGCFPAFSPPVRHRWA